MKGSTEMPAVILGAHYDHLGHGETSTSLARDAETNLVHPPFLIRWIGFAGVPEAVLENGENALLLRGFGHG